MTSSRQLQANKANAKKSTGPSSDLGKAESRRNALKHGLTAETLVIVGEKPAEFDKFRDAMMEQLDPRGQIEAELVGRLVGLMWRLRRGSRCEAAIFDARLEQATENDSRQRRHSEADTDTGSRLHLGKALVWDALGGALGNLGRHETTLTNNFKKTLEMLLAIQERRAESEGRRLTVDVVAEPTDEAEISRQLN